MSFRVAAAFCCAFVINSAWFGCTTTEERASFTARELLVADRLDANTRDALARLLDPSLALADRRGAAFTLLNQGDAQSDKALVAALEDPGAPQASAAIVQALLLRPDAPSFALKPPLTEALFVASADTRMSIAEVLGRYDDPQLTTTLRQRAADVTLSHATRLSAIAGLGFQRDREAARALITISQPPTPDDLRYAAYDALGELSGLDNVGPDPNAWAQWWDQARRLSNERWQATLVENLARRDATRRLRQDQTEQRLLESQRTLYRTTSPQDRPAVLAYMLNEPLTPIRRLGMDLTLERMLEGLPFDEPLRQALRARLTDADAEVRRLAATRLTDLNDAPAADIVAQRLTQRNEHVTETLNAALRMMARMPRGEAVPAALALLDRPPSHAAAAGALAAMAKAGMLDEAQSAEAARLVRGKLRRNELPAPAVVTLLGRVGSESDWQWIGSWIDARDPSVKRAAAEAWAESDRSLRPLADRMNDTVIQPIVIAAATRRGSDPQTLRALAAHPPARSQTFDAWRRAMVAMAGRVPPTDALSTVNELMATSDLPAELFEQMLTASLERPGGEPVGPADRVELMLRRAEVRLQRGQPAAARDDYAALGGALDGLSAAQRDRYFRGAVDANLLTDRPDAAFALARATLGDAAARPLDATDDPVVDRFIEYARRQAAARNDAAARDTLVKLRDLLGQRVKPEVANRVALLLAELNQRTPPPATAGEASPATPLN